MIKLDATSDDEDDQAVFAYLLMFTLLCGPLAALLMFLSIARLVCCPQPVAASHAENFASLVESDEEDSGPHAENMAIAARMDDEDSLPSVQEFLKSIGLESKYPSFVTRGYDTMEAVNAIKNMKNLEATIILARDLNLTPPESRVLRSSLGIPQNTKEPPAGFSLFETRRKEPLADWGDESYDRADLKELWKGVSI